MAICTLDITEFLAAHDMGDYSASIAELGVVVRRITWANALRIAHSAGAQFIAEGIRMCECTGEQVLAEVRSWAISSGGWEEDEADGWSNVECIAFLVQSIAGDIREGGINDAHPDLLTAAQWRAYETAVENGQARGTIHREELPRAIWRKGGPRWRYFYTLSAT